MRDHLSRIRIKPDALTLIERILFSCVSINKPVGIIRFGKKRATLLDLFDRSPLPALGLYQLCQATNPGTIFIDTVIDFFSGPIHAQAIAEYLKNPDQFTTATGQPFLARMKEINIHLNNEENLSQFGLLDLALAGQIISKSKRIVDIKSDTLLVKNCVLPPNLDLDAGDWALCHFGALITKLDQQQVKRVQNLRFESQNILQLIKSSPTIDCRNFCPLSLNNQGCDLTQWNLERQ